MFGVHVKWILRGVFLCMCKHGSFNPAVAPWGLCNPSPLWLTFFFETVMNTDIAFHVFLRKALPNNVTHSLGFVSFRIFYLCLFPLGDKWTPLYLPCSIGNCLQNTENTVCVSAFMFSKVPKTKSCLFVDIWVQTCTVKYYLGGKEDCNKLCLYYGFFFLQWGHIDPMVLLT